MNILVAEPMAPAGVALLQSQPGWNVIVSNPKEYAEHIGHADALLVRSAVKVTADVLARAPRLRVIGRAGIGVDNVDLKAATAAGVLVMNTPGGNAVSVAEHTLALMLAMARSIPQASASTKAGKWEKKKFLGNELRGKTLGVLGLGSIGREVVRRAKPFEMRVIASDPYVNAQSAEDLGVELVQIDTLYSESDYITLHVALTPETQGMLGDSAFARMKTGVRILNCARGELVDNAALTRAFQSGTVAGAALDVFQTEPPPANDPLLAFETLIATPHIGGSTEEAQEIVGVRIAEQLVEYLQNGIALNAVNMPALTPEQYRAVGPYIALAERLGRFAAFVADANPSAVRIAYSGTIADQNTALLRNAALAGVLSRSLGTRVNLVNAMQIAGGRNLGVQERHDRRSTHSGAIRVEIETARTETAVEGAVILDKPRLLQVDGIHCEAPLDGNLIYCKNYDVPGMIGFIGTVLGRNGVNIANFSLGREDKPSQPGHPLEAMSVIETDQPVPDTVIAELLANPGMKLVRVVEVSGNSGARPAAG
jgi:D-3-phosphoglycerate dehydrogenase